MNVNYIKFLQNLLSQIHTIKINAQSTEHIYILNQC